MNIYTWYVILFRDAYGLCKDAIKNYDVDFWDMWDMLQTHCEMYDEGLVRINFVKDGFLPMDENLDKEEFDYNCLFNLIIGTIRKECLAKDNWMGNEVYIDMAR